MKISSARRNPASRPMPSHVSPVSGKLATSICRFMEANSSSERVDHLSRCKEKRASQAARSSPSNRVGYLMTNRPRPPKALRACRISLALPSVAGWCSDIPIQITSTGSDQFASGESVRAFALGVHATLNQRIRNAERLCMPRHGEHRRTGVGFAW